MTRADWLARAIAHYDALAAQHPAEDERSWWATDLGVIAAAIATVPEEVHTELEARQDESRKRKAVLMADLLRDNDTGSDDDRDEWPLGSVRG